MVRTFINWLVGFVRDQAIGLLLGSTIVTGAATAALGYFQAVPYQVAIGLGLTSMTLGSVGLYLWINETPPAAPQGESQALFSTHASARLAELYDRVTKLAQYYPFGLRPPRCLSDPPPGKERVSDEVLQSALTLESDWLRFVAMEFGEARSRLMAENFSVHGLCEVDEDCLIPPTVDALQYYAQRLKKVMRDTIETGQPGGIAFLLR